MCGAIYRDYVNVTFSFDGVIYYDYLSLMVWFITNYLSFSLLSFILIDGVIYHDCLSSSLMVWFTTTIFHPPWWCDLSRLSSISFARIQCDSEVSQPNFCMWSLYTLSLSAKPKHPEILKAHCSQRPKLEVNYIPLFVHKLNCMFVEMAGWMSLRQTVNNIVIIVVINNNNNNNNNKKKKTWEEA